MLENSINSLYHNYELERILYSPEIQHCSVSVNLLQIASPERIFLIQR